MQHMRPGENKARANGCSRHWKDLSRTISFRWRRKGLDGKGLLEKPSQHMLELVRVGQPQTMCCLWDHAEVCSGKKAGHLLGRPVRSKIISTLDDQGWQIERTEAFSQLRVLQIDGSRPLPCSIDLLVERTGEGRKGFASFSPRLLKGWPPLLGNSGPRQIEKREHPIGIGSSIIESQVRP